jgi:hypothetical protein
MIQTFHLLDPPTAGEFHQAVRTLRRDYGVENSNRRAFMFCLHRRSETRWPLAEFVNQDALGDGTVGMDPRSAD